MHYATGNATFLHHTLDQRKHENHSNQNETFKMQFRLMILKIFNENLFLR